jgi:hypothetical protein
MLAGLEAVVEAAGEVAEGGGVAVAVVAAAVVAGAGAGEAVRAAKAQV